MTAPKLRAALVVIACAAAPALWPREALAPAPKPATAGATPAWTGTPPLRPARTVEARYDPKGCRAACERKGFWGAEAQRMVNACKIGCSLGGAYCQ